MKHFTDWNTVVPIDHGYDETKPESELTLTDMQGAAKFRGGACLSDTMKKGDWKSKLQFRCAFGHTFDASPRLVLEGGHWCPECERKSWNYGARAKADPFFAQVWNPLHSPNEMREYPKQVTMRVLLAEDEKRMATALVALLKQEKYDVDHMADGFSALTAMESGVYDIAILDVMMPELNGFEVARQARSHGIKTPVLMLTAKSELDDKVTGLDCGADDYLTKPFQTAELLARLRALGRRSSSFHDGNLRYGDLSLDTSAAMLTCEVSGQSVRLSEKELRILEYMFSNQGQIMTREQLAVKIWGFDHEAE